MACQKPHRTDSRLMDYSDQKIRTQIVAGLRAGPWQIEMEEIDYGEKLGVFYRSKDGVKRAVTETRGKTEDQIAFALLSTLMNKPDLQEITELTVVRETLRQAAEAGLISPYEGKRGKHPNNCTCSKHLRVNGSQAA